MEGENDLAAAEAVVECKLKFTGEGAGGPIDAPLGIESKLKLVEGGEGGEGIACKLKARAGAINPLPAVKEMGAEAATAAARGISPPESAVCK